MEDLRRHLREAHGITAFQHNLRQLVYGGNDGIVTTFAIVAGFAGAGAESAAELGAVAVILFGLANLFADATSMGLGEFLSHRSERDLYRAVRKRELELMRTKPDAEYSEVVELLRLRDVSDTDALAYADILERNPQMMADFMMRYEFDMGSGDESSGIRAGLVTFFSFLIFGAVPLIPYFLRDPDQTAFVLSVTGSLAALTALGLLRYIATRERPLRCVFETLVVGIVCGVVAFAVGAIIGG